MCLLDILSWHWPTGMGGNHATVLFYCNVAELHVEVAPV